MISYILLGILAVSIVIIVFYLVKQIVKAIKKAYHTIGERDRLIKILDKMIRKRKAIVTIVMTEDSDKNLPDIVMAVLRAYIGKRFNIFFTSSDNLAPIVTLVNYMDTKIKLDLQYKFEDISCINSSIGVYYPTSMKPVFESEPFKKTKF